MQLYTYIDSTGKLTQSGVVINLSPELDAEALRLVRSVPEWIPAHRDGKPVDSGPMIMVGFHLDGNGQPLSPEAYKAKIAEDFKPSDENKLRIGMEYVISLDTEKKMSDFLTLLSNPNAKISDESIREDYLQMDAQPYVRMGDKLYTSGFDWSSVDAASLRQIMICMNVREVLYEGKTYNPKTVIILSPKK